MNGHESTYPLSPPQLTQSYCRRKNNAVEAARRQVICRLHRELDFAMMREAWNRVAARHSILRTIFDRNEQQDCRQRVAPALDHPFRLVDAAPAELDELAREEAAGALLVPGGAPYRLLLLRHGHAHYTLLFTFDSLLLDARSAMVILKDFLGMYDRTKSGQGSGFRVVKQYKQYLEWLSEQTQARNQAYWSETMKGISAPTPIPIVSRESRSSLRRTHEFRLGADCGARIFSLVQEHELTVSSFVHAAWGVLLSRYSREEEVLFGISRSCRPYIEGAENMTGVFTNILPLRVQVRAESAILPWLKKMRADMLTPALHDQVSLERVHKWSDVPEQEPLFQSCVVVERVLFPRLLVPPEGYRYVEDTGFPISLHCYASADQEILFRLHWDPEAIESDAVHRMAGHLTTILDGMAQDVSRRVLEVPTLTEEERRMTLCSWNATGAELPPGTLDRLIDETAARRGEETAVEEQDRKLTYRQLSERSNRLANYLNSAGIERESLVGIYMERSIDSMIALLAVLKAGAAYVPLDPKYPIERIEYMLQDTNVRLLLTQSDLADLLPETDARIVQLDRDWNEIQRFPAGRREPASSPESAAYVIYTSGSTGNPKGVVIEHRSFLNHAIAVSREYRLDASDRVLQFASLSFDVAAEEIFPTWLQGGCLVLRHEEMTQNFDDFHRFVEERGVTVLNIPTAFWHEWVRELSANRQPLPASVRLVIVGGERAEPEMLELWQRMFGDQVRWLNCYGPTESTITSTIYDPARLAGGSRPGEVPIGRPIANTRIYVLDCHMQPVAVGVPGELCIGGAGVARGYLGRPEMTAEKFPSDPFSEEPNARFYRTGDLAGYLPDGNLVYLGRVDEQVKIRGFRIETGEIETLLARYPGVRESVVVARKDGTGDKRLIAYIVPAEQKVFKGQELRNYLRGKVPEYMVPASFIVLNSLPLTPSGKVDRRALPEVENLQRQELERTFAAPKDPIELQLAQLFEKALGIQPVGVHDDFFDLGGHSLLAARLFSDIKKWTGKNLPLATLLQAPTVARLADILRSDQWVAPWSSLVLIKPGRNMPPFFLVHAIGGNVIGYRELAYALDPDQPVYGFQAVGLDGAQPPHSTIARMAEHYIQEMLTVQPVGPYMLGGLSSGGVIAYEMAQQLRAMGQRVSLLALFDTDCPGYLKTLSRQELYEFRWQSYRQRLAYHLRHIFLGPDRIEYLRSKKRTLKRQMRATIWQYMYGYYHRTGKALPPRYHKVYDATRHAVNSYEPQPYPEDVVLFRALERSLGSCPDIDNGWGRLVRKVTVREVPGNHLSVLREPSVRVLAGELMVHLKSAVSRERQDEPEMAPSA